MRSTRAIALSTAALFGASMLAACGDDDGGTTTDAAANGSEAESNGEAAGDQGDGQPSELFADSLDDVDMPDTGTAVITVDGVTWEFDDLNRCEISSGMNTTGFYVNGSGETDDGFTTLLEVFRTVHDDGDMGVGGIYERDWVQLSVQMESDSGQLLFSNTNTDTTRDDLGGPVSGDSSSLPVVKVVDEDGTVMATAVGEITFPPFVGEIDAAGEGPFEFAANCG